MKIAILGLGYVGMTAAACLASQGHQVLGIDPNPTKVDAVLAGKSPITEPGLNDLVADAHTKGRLLASTSLSPEVAEYELVIVCVGTPSAVDGSHNMSYIAEATRQLAEFMKVHSVSDLTVAYRSTMRPGSIEELIQPLSTAHLAQTLAVLMWCITRSSSANRPPLKTISRHQKLSLAQRIENHVRRSRKSTPGLKHLCFTSGTERVKSQNL